MPIFFMYIIIGLILSVWAYKESYKIIMKCLKLAGKPTIFEKILFFIVFLVSTSTMTLTWPVWLTWVIIDFIKKINNSH